VLFSPKGVMRIRQSKKDRQYNGQKKKDKRTNNNLQNITRKTTDRVTQTQLIDDLSWGFWSLFIPEVKLRCRKFLLRM
jgi:hypothetical protein